MKKVLCHTIFILLFAFAGLSNHSPQLRFHRISVEQGLSQSYVYSIIQTRKGFMWFATADGLNRYDGFNFKIFRSSSTDSESLSHNVVRVLYEDRQGVLWVGTKEGLNKYNQDFETFTHFQHNPSDPESLSHNNVWVITEDRSGNLIVGTDSGLSRLNRQTGKFTHLLHNPYQAKSLSSKHVRSVFEKEDGLLWVGTTNDGLNQLDPETGLVAHIQMTISKPAETMKVMKIYSDSSGNIWVGTWGTGLFRYKKSGATWTNYTHLTGNQNTLSNDHIWAIHEDQQGILWIGTFNGLNRYQPETDSFIQYHHQLTNQFSISNNIIRSIYEDAAGILWFGTSGGGVNSHDFHSNQFRHIYRNSEDQHSLSDNKIKSICQGPDGQTWIGTEGGGLNLFDQQMNVITVFKHDPTNPDSISNNRIFSLLVDHEGILWAGTNGGGLNKMVSEENFIHYTNDPEKPDSISHNRIWTIFEDSSHTLWIGTNEGLNSLDRKTSKFTRYIEDPENPYALQDNRIWCIMEMPKGTLWIGTSGGLHRFDKATETFKLFRHIKGDPKSLSQNMVLSLHSGTPNDLWLGTYGGGLNNFNLETETFTHFTKVDGLSNNVVYGVLKDHDGFIWVSTNFGITRFDPSRGEFKTFDKETGLQGNEFNGGAYYQSEKGEFFFGGMNGFNMFYPRQITSSTYIPPVLVVDFQLFNKSVQLGINSILKKSITETKAIQLNHKENVFSFEFASLHYKSPGKNQFAYILEGFEDKWNYVDSRRFAFYTSLPPDDYVFRVKGTNSDGLWNDVGTSIAISILPPFWLTTWFKLLAIVFLGSIFTILYKRRISKLKVNELQALLRTFDLEQSQLALLTAQTELEDKVKEATKDLNNAQKIAKVGSWALDINTQKLTWSDETYRIFDMEKRKERDLVLKDFTNNIQDYDGLLLVEAYDKQFNGIMSHESTHRIETRRHKIKWIEERCETTYDQEGYPLISIGTIQDITEKKNKEISLKNQEKLLQQQSRLAQMGEMISMIAHQWRQPLGAISSAIIGIQSKIALGKFNFDITEDRDKFLNFINRKHTNISEYVQSLSETIDDFRRFFKPDQKKELVCLNTPINRALNIVEISMKNKGISIVHDFQIEDNISIYPNELMQVVLNILKNSEDNFIEKNISNAQINISTIKENGHNIIEISDNGGGIPQYIMPNIFDPYFSTKDKKDGTGLGLYMSKIMIEEHHNGELNVVNTSNGVSFRIILKD